MKKYLTVWFLCLVLIVSLGNVSYARTTVGSSPTIDASTFTISPDGTSTNPSITFWNERTLGFYRSGTGVISLTGGTLSMLGGSYSLTDADVAHGMTDIAATNVYGLLNALDAADKGGLRIQGLSDGDAIPLYIRGIIGSTNPTDTLEAISIVGAKKNGTGVQALGSTETVLQILNNTTELNTLLGDGSWRQPASTYHNFGATIGTSGYGLFDDAGTIKFKNSAGAWIPIAGGWQDDGTIVRLTTGTDNVGVNATAAGTSATSTMVFGQWTAPTTSPADVAQLGAADMQSAPGMTRLHQRTEAGITSPLALHDEVNSLANPRRPSQAINMLVAASGSTGITIADNANLDFGTGNFSLALKGSIPDWTPTATVVLAQKTDGTNGWNLQVLTTGVIRLTINVTNYDSTVAPVITNGMTGKIGVSVTRETASVAGSVVFYFNGTQLGASVAIGAGAPITVNNAVALYVLGTSSTRTAGQGHFFAPYNRALSAAEQLLLFRNGIDYADKWGAATALYTSNFSAGVDGWAGNWEGTNTVTGNIDTINGSDDWLKVERTDAGAGALTSHKGVTTTAGKYFKVTATVYNPAGSTITTIRITGDGALSIGTSYSIAADQELEVTHYDTATNLTVTSYIVIRSNDTTANGQIFYVKNVVLTEIGAVAAYEPEGIQSTGWLDSSTNYLNLSYPAAGASLVRKEEIAELVRPKIITYEGTGNVSAYQMAGQSGVITGAYTLSLPTAAVGYKAKFTASTAAAFSLDLQTGTDVIVLNGTALAAGNKATSDGTIYNAVEVECILAGKYMINSIVGTMSDGGA